MVGLIIAIIAVSVLLLPRTPGAAAHARPVAASPAAGSALAKAPPELRIAYSEPVDAAFSRAELLTSDGRTVPTAPATTDPSDEKTLVVRVLDPAAVTPGTYVLVWRVLSAADGHATSGTLPFSVGTGQIPTGVGSLETSGRPPWWRVLVRWTELVSMLVLVGGLVFGGFVAIPFRRASPPMKQEARWWRQIWRGATVFLAIDLVLTLVDQGLIATGSGLGDPPSFGVYRRIVFHSTFGTAWLARVAVFVCLVAIGHRIERRGRSSVWHWVLGIIFGCGLLLTVPVAGHAAGEQDRTLAVVTDWLHLCAAAAWLGGLGYLLAALIVLRRSGSVTAANVAGSVVVRFSVLALISMCLLLATGIGNAAFHVAGPRALRDQDYGVTLIVKHVVVAIVLIAAGVNLLVNRPRLRALAMLGDLDAIHRQLRATEVVVAFELVFGMAIVLAAAALTELAPADAPLAIEVAAKEVVVDQRADAGDLGVWLLGRLSGNPDDRFTVSVTSPGGQPPTGLQRLIVEASVTAAGGSAATTDRFDAQPLTGGPGGYEFPAVRLGLQGVWDVTVIVRRAGLEDVKASFAVDTRQAGVPPPRAANDAWRLPRFTFGAWALFALAAVAAVGGVLGVRRLPRLEPTAAALILTMVALIAAGFTVSAVRQTIPMTDDTNLINPLSGDAGSVQRGAGIYAANCVACHGAAGAGVVTTDPAHAHGSSADLTDGRSRGERDGDLYHAVSKGVPGSAMPAYDWALSEDERWDVVNYVRQLQRAATK
jgi:copper transport protein